MKHVFYHDKKYTQWDRMTIVIENDSFEEAKRLAIAKSIKNDQDVNAESIGGIEYINPENNGYQSTEELYSEKNDRKPIWTNYEEETVNSTFINTVGDLKKILNKFNDSDLTVLETIDLTNGSTLDLYPFSIDKVPNVKLNDGSIVSEIRITQKTNTRLDRHENIRCPRRSIEWNIYDFEERAHEVYGEHWELHIDKSLFPVALYNMMDNYDANNGITNQDVDDYIAQYCMIQE